jgi:hypothetical protein
MNKILTSYYLRNRTSSKRNAVYLNNEINKLKTNLKNSVSRSVLSDSHSVVSTTTRDSNVSTNSRKSNQKSKKNFLQVLSLPRRSRRLSRNLKYSSFMKSINDMENNYLKRQRKLKTKRERNANKRTLRMKLRNNSQR